MYMELDAGRDQVTNEVRFAIVVHGIIHALESFFKRNVRALSLPKDSYTRRAVGKVIPSHSLVR